MTVTHLFTGSIGDAAPGGLALAAAGAGGISGALPDLQARIAALASFAPQPPNLIADIALAQGIITSLQASLTLGITPPSISAQIAIVAAQLAALQAAALAIQAQLDIIVSIESVLNTAGVHGYAYTGAANQLGADFSAALSAGFPGGGPTDSTNAILLATTLSPTWAAMAQFFRTTP